LYRDESAVGRAYLETKPRLFVSEKLGTIPFAKKREQAHDLQ